MIAALSSPSSVTEMDAKVEELLKRSKVVNAKMKAYESKIRHSMRKSKGFPKKEEISVLEKDTYPEINFQEQKHEMVRKNPCTSKADTNSHKISLLQSRLNEYKIKKGSAKDLSLLLSPKYQEQNNNTDSNNENNNENNSKYEKEDMQEEQPKEEKQMKGDQVEQKELQESRGLERGQQQLIDTKSNEISLLQSRLNEYKIKKGSAKDLSLSLSPKYQEQNNNNENTTKHEKKDMQEEQPKEEKQREGDEVEGKELQESHGLEQRQQQRVDTKSNKISLLQSRLNEYKMKKSSARDLPLSVSPKHQEENNNTDNNNVNKPKDGKEHIQEEEQPKEEKQMEGGQIERKEQQESHGLEQRKQQLIQKQPSFLIDERNRDQLSEEQQKQQVTSIDQDDKVSIHELKVYISTSEAKKSCLMKQRRHDKNEIKDDGDAYRRKIKETHENKIKALKERLRDYQKKSSNRAIPGSKEEDKHMQKESEQGGRQKGKEKTKKSIKKKLKRKRNSSTTRNQQTMDLDNCNYMPSAITGNACGDKRHSGTYYGSSSEDGGYNTGRYNSMSLIDDDTLASIKTDEGVLTDNTKDICHEEAERNRPPQQLPTQKGEKEEERSKGREEAVCSDDQLYNTNVNTSNLEDKHMQKESEEGGREKGREKTKKGIKKKSSRKRNSSSTRKKQAIDQDHCNCMPSSITGNAFDEKRHNESSYGSSSDDGDYNTGHCDSMYLIDENNVPSIKTEEGVLPDDTKVICHEEAGRNQAPQQLSTQKGETEEEEGSNEREEVVCSDDQLHNTNVDTNNLEKTKMQKESKEGRQKGREKTKKSIKKKSNRKRNSSATRTKQTIDHDHRNYFPSAITSNPCDDKRRIETYDSSSEVGDYNTGRFDSMSLIVDYNSAGIKTDEGFFTNDTTEIWYEEAEQNQAHQQLPTQKGEKEVEEADKEREEVVCSDGQLHNTNFITNNLEDQKEEQDEASQHQQQQHQHRQQPHPSSISIIFPAAIDPYCRKEKEEDYEDYPLFFSDSSYCSELSDDEGMIDSDDDTLGSVNRIVKRDPSFYFSLYDGGSITSAAASLNGGNEEGRKPRRSCLLRKHSDSSADNKSCFSFISHLTNKSTHTDTNRSKRRGFKKVLKNGKIFQK